MNYTGQNYVALLTKEEKGNLCDAITGRYLKKIFKENEKDFSKILKGFRAKTLSDQRALSIAKANMENPILTLQINATVDLWLKEIGDNIDKLEKEGLSQEDALATAILDSNFGEHVDLYFKLIGKSQDKDTWISLYENMERIKTDYTRVSEDKKGNETREIKNIRMTVPIDTSVQNTETIKATYEQKILEIKQEKTEVEFLLSEAQEKIAELQNTVDDFHNHDADNLMKYDDTNTSALPSIGSTDIVSICSVISDYSGQVWLNRIADLNHNGIFYSYHKNDDALPNFANRDRLFCKDCPFEDGFYGIWTWSAKPNKKDPSKDYVISNCNDALDVIEVFIFDKVSNLESLVNLLKDGVEYKPRSLRVMFSLQETKGKYISILCNKKDLCFDNGKASFAEDCNTVPVYEFTGADIVRSDNDFLFYRKAFAGIPRKLYHVKKPLEMVKEIVSSSVSWNACKARGLTRSEFKTIKEFFASIPVDNILVQIESKCGCSNAVAKELLDEFVDIAWKYVDGKSLEDKIILSVVSANMDLQQKTKDLIRLDWEKENKSLLNEAEEKLALIDAELKTKAERLTQMQETLNKTKSENERLSGVIAEKEKLAGEVEMAVAKRINKARENAADFIADMAFVSGVQSKTTPSEVPEVAKNPTGSFHAPYRVFPAIEDIDALEVHHSWEDVINTTVFELGEAGVAEQYRGGLAAFLCAAYIEKQPVLLVGPNSVDIIQAFVASIAAHKYGMLCCEGDCISQTIAEIGASGESIVMINNLLASGWMNRLPEVLSSKDIFYVATHPYAEDIQVEPKSLYGFMLPLFTEAFVDRKATGKYYGGYFADDFKSYSASKKPHKKIKTLSRFALNSLIKNRINNVVGIMRDIHPTTTAEDEFLFAVFPIAYASLTVDELTELIADPQKGITISSNLKRDLQYALGGET